VKLKISDFRFQIGAAAGAAVIGLLLSGAPRAEVLDRVLALVSGELILLSDVRSARQFGFVSVEGPDADNRALARLIDRALILAEVERFAPPEPDAPSVDKGVAMVRERFSSPEAFVAALARVGIEERHLREHVRQDLRMAAYLDQRFTTVPPTEEEVGRYYRENPNLYTRDGVLIPFETARPDIVLGLTAQNRQAVVDEWVAGLRRRADVRIASQGNRGIE
jgi:peptidyl-prolyl cis-trans isomerase SurA